MSTTSAPRVALVTGGSGGIGQAVVEKLAADGFAVAVHYAGNKDKAGAIVVSQQAARRVRAGGAIVNFSTTVTRTSFPGYGAYVASKAAVEGMTLILARELRGKDITVNAVAPGPTATALFLDGKDDAAVASLSKAAPLERLGQPEDIAETVAFLAGPARWVNGQVIFANGGLA
jgi:3-oxoacyl-[acyl-carrier protein] reductase